MAWKTELLDPELGIAPHYTRSVEAIPHVLINNRYKKVRFSKVGMSSGPRTHVSLERNE